jgi:hypothetical protein
MRHPRVTAFELQLKAVFDQMDHELEADYGKRYTLHPARPRQHETGNPEMDGLINIGASFSPGFGSRTGEGYIVELRLATLDPIKPELLHEIEERVIARLRVLLPAAFPNRTLHVVRDGHVFKISGDLSLGTA